MTKRNLSQSTANDDTGAMRSTSDIDISSLSPPMVNRSWIFGSIGVVSLVVIACLLAFVIPQTCLNNCGKPASANQCFRAAVLDHVHQIFAGANGTDDHTARLATIESNLRQYERSGKLAKEQNADIVVFPENGIIFALLNRAAALRYGEPIPSERIALCDDQDQSDHKQSPLMILKRLACIAKRNQIFVVANMIDVQDCVNDPSAAAAADNSAGCRPDHKYAFNTAVLFDRTGTLLGKYHKMHPFGEMSLDVPPKDELLVFDTELGRLGLQVCFDMIYEKPGVLLAAEHRIDTMLFPTWWFDEMPFLAASQYQMAWSIGNEINLLASNIHMPELGSMGSGVYAGGNAHSRFATLNIADRRSRLLIGTIPQKPSYDQCELDAKTIEVPHQISAAKPETKTKSEAIYHYKTMSLSETEVVKLDADGREVSKCHRGVCCTLQYRIDRSTMQTAKEEYYLIVTNRTRPGAYPWTEEFCGLVNCPPTSGSAKPCAAAFGTNKELSTDFVYAKMIGIFSDDTRVYPSVVGSQHRVLPKENGEWSYQVERNQTIDGRVSQRSVLTIGDADHNDNAKDADNDISNQIASSTHKLLAFGLYGRAYSRDPPYHQSPTNGIL